VSSATTTLIFRESVTASTSETIPPLAPGIEGLQKASPACRFFRDHSAGYNSRETDKGRFQESALHPEYSVHHAAARSGAEQRGREKKSTANMAERR